MFDHRETAAARRPRGKRRLQMTFHQTLSGLGPLRACQLLDRFETIEKVIAASAANIHGVEGIGAGTARAIWEVAREDAIPCDSSDFALGLDLIKAVGLPGP